MSRVRYDHRNRGLFTCKNPSVPPLSLQHFKTAIPAVKVVIHLPFSTPEAGNQYRCSLLFYQVSRLSQDCKAPFNESTYENQREERESLEMAESAEEKYYFFK